MKIIDCNCCIGLGAVNRIIVNHENYLVYEKVKQAPTAKDVIDEMDYCGVSKAMVYHQAMIDVDPDYGNKKIIEEVNPYSDRLMPTWTILPPITESQFMPEILIDDMRKNNIRALRAYPEWNRYFLNAITMGELLEMLADRKIPLFLSPDKEWGFTFNVLEEFPSLTVIITNYGLWGSDRYFFPLVKTYENVYIDTSDYQVLGGYENFVNRFGSERLIFGSNYPMDNIGGVLTTMVGSGISSGDIENIAYKNFERLMKRVEL